MHSASWLATLVVIAGVRATGAGVDISKLPPPAKTTVVFSRDIQPILENNCLRCHGPERPKSRFRLDNREDALKGGRNGVDIISGDSANSDLIHYVAGLDPDMQMPPTGKGDPLKPVQIALLRTWIDQGLDWTASAESQPPKFEMSLTPGFNYVTVSGNERKFRELFWQHEGFSGGFMDFNLKERVSKDTTFQADGHAVYDQNDYRFRFNLDKRDLGFVRFGIEQFRKYSDDTGGFQPGYQILPYTLDRELHLDVGRIWVDVGLARPDWPRMTLGYEYQYRNGMRSTLEWGDVVDNAGNSSNIYPAFHRIDERTHIIKFDAAHEISGIGLEDSLRIEFYDLRSGREDVSTARTLGLTGVEGGRTIRGTFYADPLAAGKDGPDRLSQLEEGDNHFQAANAFRMEKQLNDWLFLSGGYLYSHLSGEAFLNQNTFLTPNAVIPPTTDLDFSGNFWFTPNIVLRQDSHVFNFNTSLGPWKDLVFNAGIQTEWMHQTGFGSVQVDEGFPDPPFLLLDANYSRATLDELFGVRYSGLPYTVLFAEGRFSQEDLSQNERQEGGFREFIQDSEIRSDLKDYRAGVTISPWSQLSLTTTVRERTKRTVYDNLRDEQPMGVPGTGYPAFILARRQQISEVQSKLTWKPRKWLNAFLSYHYTDTSYRSRTDAAGTSSQGGELQAGRYRANSYSVGATVIPHPRLNLSASFTYDDAKTSTEHNKVAVLEDYRGNTYAASSSLTFLVSDKTHWDTTYTFSKADYGASNPAEGLPLGAVYQLHSLQSGITHRFNKTVSGSIRYSYYLYDDISAARATDFTAHGVMTSLTFILR